jgi:hypothetical protein
MSPATTIEPMAPQRRHPHRRRRPVLVPVALLVAVAGVVVAAVLGGLEKAPDPEPERLGKGDVVDQQRIRTKFEQAIVLPGGEAGVGVQGERWLHIRLQVTNQSEETVQAYGVVDRTIPTVRADGKAIKYPGQDFSESPRIQMHVNGRNYNQIHPGVTAPVTMAFELPENATPPRKVEIDVARYVRFLSFFYNTVSWEIESEEAESPDGKPRSVPIVHARVELPVEVKEGA